MSHPNLSLAKISHFPQFHRMKEITFTTDEETLALALAEATALDLTLDEMFDAWLKDIARRGDARKTITALFPAKTPPDAEPSEE